MRNHKTEIPLNFGSNKIDIYYATSSLGAVPFNFIYDFFTALYPNMHKPSKSYMESHK